MYRSQLLLHQLGIQQWIPQQQVTQKTSANVLWMDQEIDHQAFVASAPVAVVNAPVQRIETNVIATKAVLPSQTKEVQEQQTFIQSNTSSIGLIEEPEYSQDIKFHYQVIANDRLIIVANVENEQEQQLLNNICKACHASIFHLQWPLALATWDMNDFVLQGYLQGVFAIHQQKTLIHLGEIESEQFLDFAKQFKRYASLKQLLESAEQKRALWQALYPLIYDVEQ